MEDKNLLEILKLTLNSQIRMRVNGDTNTYKFSDNPNENEGFELYAIDADKEGTIYGLSCSCVIEVISVLIQDYFAGIIDEVEWVHNPEIKIMDENMQEVAATLVSSSDAPYLEYKYTKKIRKYNPNYGDNRMCVCGHPYHRHFDSYKNMDPCGCKYCGCNEFVEQMSIGCKDCESCPDAFSENSQ